MPSLGIIQKGKIVAKATTAVKVTAADESTDATCNLLFCTDATGDLPPKTGSNRDPPLEIWPPPPLQDKVL